ncbi:MAG: peptidyl-prolyl cis-trans isomerase [Solirubrobacteraceae bacterium]
MPATDAAVVAGNPITKRAVLHWMYIDAKGEAAQDPGAPVIVPSDPPEFPKCIAQVKKEIPTLAKESDAKIRTACQSAFTSYSQAVMGFLITGYWYQGTAHKLGIALTNAQLQQAIAKAKTQSGIKTAAAYKQFLSTSGYTANDISFRIRISTIYSKLLKRHPTAVTSAEIASYYAAHKSSYGSAEKLNLRIVLAKTQANANAAKSALQSGQSWDAVAKKYSIDPTTKDSGGLEKGVTANQQDAALSKAAFAAPLNKLEGPIKGQFGYYVFTVLQKTPATQETLKQASAAIKQTLTTSKQSAAEKAVNAQVSSQWKSSTVCSKLFAITDCANYVKPPASATATAPTTTPTPTVTTKGGTKKPSPKSSKTSSTTSSSSSK